MSILALVEKDQVYSVQDHGILVDASKNQLAGGKL